MTEQADESDAVTVICLLCEYGLCFRGCWSPRCECPSEEHRRIDYEAERPTSPGGTS